MALRQLLFEVMAVQVFLYLCVPPISLVCMQPDGVLRSGSPHEGLYGAGAFMSVHAASSQNPAGGGAAGDSRAAGVAGADTMCRCWWWCCRLWRLPSWCCNWWCSVVTPITSDEDVGFSCSCRMFQPVSDLPATSHDGVASWGWRTLFGGQCDEQSVCFTCTHDTPARHAVVASLM